MDSGYMSTAPSSSLTDTAAKTWSQTSRAVRLCSANSRTAAVACPLDSPLSTKLVRDRRHLDRVRSSRKAAIGSSTAKLPLTPFLVKYGTNLYMWTQELRTARPRCGW